MNLNYLTDVHHLASVNKCGIKMAHYLFSNHHTGGMVIFSFSWGHYILQTIIQEPEMYFFSLHKLSSLTSNQAFLIKLAPPTYLVWVGSRLHFLIMEIISTSGMGHFCHLPSTAAH